MNYLLKIKKSKARCIAPLFLVILEACGGSTGNTDLPPRLLANTVVAADYTTIVQQLYISYFGRPADSGGLGNFRAQLAALGGPTDIQGLDQAYRSSAAIKSLVDSFGVSAESAALYSGDNTAFVTAIYKNILNRTPDSAGLAFWVGALDGGGVTRANASLSIMAGALINASTQGKLDASLVNRKVTVGVNFTNALIAAPVNGYSGDAAAAQARAMLASVSATTDTTAFQDTIATLVRYLAPVPSGYVKEGGLTWTPANEVFFNWAQANTYCTTNTFNGSTGWRLPTMFELAGMNAPITEHAFATGGLYVSGLTTGQGWSAVYLWSSTRWNQGQASENSNGYNGVFFKDNPKNDTLDLPYRSKAGQVASSAAEDKGNVSCVR